jgi:hypothetical protein
MASIAQIVQMAPQFVADFRKITRIVAVGFVCVSSLPYAQTTVLEATSHVEKRQRNLAVHTSLSDDQQMNAGDSLSMQRGRPKNLLSGLAAQTLDEDRVRNIRMRRGGELIKHINEAARMIASGRSYRVIEDQYSAAAMQVLFVESQVPDRICAGRRAKLHFHLSMNLLTRKPDTKPDWAFVAFIRPENLKRLGKLPQYGKGFKTVQASDFLGLCEP